MQWTAVTFLEGQAVSTRSVLGTTRLATGNAATCLTYRRTLPTSSLQGRRWKLPASSSWSQAVDQQGKSRISTARVPERPSFFCSCSPYSVEVTTQNPRYSRQIETLWYLTLLPGVWD
jgi:hypothetical protein